MSKITVQILGTTAGVPTSERGHTAIHVTHSDGEQKPLLFDCGEGTQRQLMKAGINMMRFDDVFITHWHGDHCLGLPGMVDTLGFEGRKKPLTVYAPEVSRLNKCIGLNYPMGRFKLKKRNISTRGRRLRNVLKTDRFDVVAIPVKHSIPTLAYAIIEKDKVSVDMRKAITLGLPQKGEFYSRLKEKGKVTVGGKKIRLKEISHTVKGKKIVYSGDTEVCDNLRRIVHGADLLIMDCTYFEEVGKDKPHRHASLPEVVKMVTEEKVKRTVLTHISRKYHNTGQLKDMAKLYPNLEVAEDFMTVTV
ncbi:MBL fold metallo-hydrolase [Candidatus Omnitrophota bacterium]